MMIIIPNYKVSFKTQEHEVELIVSGRENVETLIKILFFNGVGDYLIEEENKDKDQVYRIKVDEIDKDT